MSSRIKDSQHDGAHGIKHSHADNYAYDFVKGLPKGHPGKEPSGSLPHDQQVMVSENSGTLSGESLTDRRSHFKAQELTGGSRDAEYHAGKQTHRRPHQVERHRPSSSTMIYRPRASSERHRERSKSPRRRRSFDWYRYREAHERRRSSLSPASRGYSSERRYSSLLFAVSRSRSRSGVLHRRTQWTPAPRPYHPVRLTQSDRRSPQLHHVRSVETVRRVGEGRLSGAMSAEQEHSRIIETDRAVEDVKNSGVERVIPKVPLAGQLLKDPRRENYCPGSRRDSHLQEYELIDRTMFTDEEHYKEAQDIYCSCDESLKLHYYSPSSYARPSVCRTCTMRSSNIYHPENHDIASSCHRTLQRCDYLGQEGQDMRVEGSRPVESQAYYCPKCPRAKNYPAPYCPVVPRPEECLARCCPRALDPALYVGEHPLTGGPLSRGFHNRLNKLHSEEVTMRSAPLMRQRPPNSERTLFHYKRDMARCIVEEMIHSIRAQNNEVEALRDDMRDLRVKIVNIHVEEKKAQEESLAFIAAVKQLMAEPTEHSLLNHTVHT
ncbi:hypothetical protein HPB51_011497 [Rhipicephalus microplus]|uniref:Uncharacterized protein n=1 Tax=Rhipicephalus microplus TaxID=6941 RepID=A0A9J6E8Q2_RHIMP|nr:hypothetical protein HPB51_011497 [Rhipicephalus microplus]